MVFKPFSAPEGKTIQAGLKFFQNTAIFQLDIPVHGYLSSFMGAYLVSTWVLNPKGHAEAQITS